MSGRIDELRFGRMIDRFRQQTARTVTFRGAGCIRRAAQDASRSGLRTRQKIHMLELSPMGAMQQDAPHDAKPEGMRSWW